MKRWIFSVFLLTIYLSGCAQQVANPSTLQPATAVPTASTDETAALCETASLRARDWQATITALEALLTLGQTCPDHDLRISQQLANAYLALGTQREAGGEEAGAIAAYEAALYYEPTMREAQERLRLLQGETTQEGGCPVAQVIDNAILAPYEATNSAFARFTDAGFTVSGETYEIHGANYYPRDTPFGYFLTETDMEAVQQELTLMRESGLNTLRVFLLYETLFTCTERGLQPNAESFQQLDALIAAAAAADFRVILVLNHVLDSTQPPVLSASAHTAQTRFIVSRYAEEPTLLAWDLRDNGDRDYSASSRQAVLTWLADMAVLVRSLDSRHPITAGWKRFAQDTAPLVDFVSFQHFGEYEQLRQEIANLRGSVNKPILLAAIGYSTYQLDETSQRNLLYQTFEEIRHNDLLGWIVYMAFDYPRTVTCTPPDCPGEARPINHYGLWNTSYFPKLAVDAVERVTGVADD